MAEPQKCPPHYMTALPKKAAASKRKKEIQLYTLQQILLTDQFPPLAHPWLVNTHCVPEYQD